MAFDPKAAGAVMNENMTSSMQGFAAASKAMQAVTNEMVSMSMDSLRQTARAFEQMQGAHNFADIVRIQQEFFRTSFEEFGKRSRKIAELASAAPIDMANRAKEAATKIGEQTQAAAKTVVHETQKATEKTMDDAKAATVGLDMPIPNAPNQ